MRYQLRKQEKNYFCGPSCLQAILGRHGEILSQEEIASQINCSEKDGSLLTEISKFLEKRGYGFEFYEYNKVPFNEPDFLLSENLYKKDVLILYPNSEENHFVIGLVFEDPQLKFIDPHDRTLCEVNLYDLMKRMFKKESGGFGLVEKLS